MKVLTNVIFSAGLILAFFVVVKVTSVAAAASEQRAVVSDTWEATYHECKAALNYCTIVIDNSDLENCTDIADKHLGIKAKN